MNHTSTTAGMAPAGGDRVSTIIAAARACLGTPFVHQGRTPGAGVDCAGLIILAARAAGITINAPEGYALPAHPQQLMHALQQLHPSALIEGGSVLLFRMGGQPQHVALATSPTTMIHAYAPAGKVVETTIGQAWLNRLIGIYTFQG